MAYCLPTCPKFCCNLSASLPGNLPIILSHTLLCISIRFYYGTITINTRIVSNYLQFQLPTIIPIFCCKVPPLMPSSCPSSCFESCILPCQQHCCQECYLSITKCNSLWRHVPGAPLSCLIWTIVIFNKIFNTNRKCLSQTFCCSKAMQHLHHMPQFLLIILFTQLAPGIVAWDMTKVSCSPRSWL